MQPVNAVRSITMYPVPQRLSRHPGLTRRLIATNPIQNIRDPKKPGRHTPLFFAPCFLSQNHCADIAPHFNPCFRHDSPLFIRDSYKSHFTLEGNPRRVSTHWAVGISSAPNLVGQLWLSQNGSGYFIMNSGITVICQNRLKGASINSLKPR